MDKLISYLKRNDLTQEAFAQRIGISQGALSKICRGLIGVDLATAVAIQRETDGDVAVGDWPAFRAVAEQIQSVGVAVSK